MKTIRCKAVIQWLCMGRIWQFYLYIRLNDPKMKRLQYKIKIMHQKFKFMQTKQLQTKPVTVTSFDVIVTFL